MKDALLESGHTGYMNMDSFGEHKPKNKPSGMFCKRQEAMMPGLRKCGVSAIAIPSEVIERIFKTTELLSVKLEEDAKL